MASRLPRAAPQRRAARLCLWLALPALVAGCREDAPSPRRPLVLVGVDAADWRVLDPLIEAGRLPSFARLRRAGRTGLLVADAPLLSPILWTTIATGRQPEDHGVLDFMVDTPDGGQAPVGSSSRRVPALWNLLSDAGRVVAVVGWWATWPAETVRGIVVSDRVAPQLLRVQPIGVDSHAICPPAARARLLPFLLRPDAVSDAELRERLPVDEPELRAARASFANPGRFYAQPVAHLAAIVAGTRSHAAIAEDVLRRDAPSLLAVYFEAIDAVSHRFVLDPRGPAAIAAACADVDAALGRLARAAPPEAWFIVVSDHGFYSASAGIAEDPADLTGPAAAWHRPYGIVAAIEARALADPGAQAVGSRVPEITPLDVAPTVLHAAGLAVGDRMPGRVVPQLLPPEAVTHPVARARLPERLPTIPALSPSSDADTLARLRALGYVGGSSSSLARQNLGEILYRRGRLEAAERELRAVTEAQPGNLAAWLWLARATADQGKAAEALRAYETALRLPGALRDAIVPAVEMALTTGGAPESLLDNVPAAERSIAPVLVARSLVARRRGQAAEAERLLRLAATTDPMNLDALERLLDTSPARHLDVFQRAAAAAPDSPRHAALHGAALLAAGQAAQARPALGRALELAPGSDSVRLHLARAQIRHGDPDAALVTLEATRPSAEGSTLRGAALSLQKRWPAAAQAYGEALKLASAETPELLNGLAWAQLQQGRRDEARALLDRSLALRSAQPRIRSLRRSLEAGS